MERLLQSKIHIQLLSTKGLSHRRTTKEWICFVSLKYTLNLFWIIKSIQITIKELSSKNIKKIWPGNKKSKRISKSIKSLSKKQRKHIIWSAPSRLMEFTILLLNRTTKLFDLYLNRGQKWCKWTKFIQFENKFWLILNKG